MLRDIHLFGGVSFQSGLRLLPNFWPENKISLQKQDLISILILVSVAIIIALCNFAAPEPVSLAPVPISLAPVHVSLAPVSAFSHVYQHVIVLKQCNNNVVQVYF